MFYDISMGSRVVGTGKLVKKRQFYPLEEMCGIHLLQRHEPEVWKQFYARLVGLGSS